MDVAGPARISKEPTPSTKPYLLTVSEAARLLAISPHTLRASWTPNFGTKTGRVKSRNRSGLLPGTIGIECVRAHRFELVDEAGRICGGLGFSDEGHPLVALTEERDGKIRARAQLILDKRGSGLTLSDTNGAHRLVLSANEGRPALLLNGANGSPRLGLFLTEKGYAGAKTFDSQGREVEFVRRAFPVRAHGDDDHGFVRLAAAGKKAEFAEALAKYGNIHETDVVEGAWRMARREAKALENSKRRGKPRGG